jgi:hypothetical protein
LRPALLALVASAATLVGVAPGIAAASPVWPQPVRYRAQLRYDAGAHVLSGSERIAFLNDGPRTLSSVWLRVWPNGYGSCAHPWARVSISGGGRAAGWSAGCTALRVRLAQPVASGGGGAVRVRLRVKVPHRPNRFGRDGGVDYLGNALPLLDVQEASGPTLEPYTDLGDPFYSLSSSWSVRLDLPRALTAATTGEVTSQRRVGGGLKRLRISAAHARDFAIVVGPFAVDSVRTGGGILLRRYRLPGQQRSTALATLRVARRVIATYSSWYGAPGEREIDLVPGPGSLGPFGAGMEFPGLVLTPDDPYLVAHELAHQWWYGLVGDDQWRSPWLDESFAEFSARRLPAAVVGQDELQCDFADPVAPFGSASLTSSMRHWDAASPDAYYRIVYLGGTCALRSLEHDLGPRAMTAFLRSYAHAHRWGVVTTADFVAALRAAAPAGYDVDAYLRRARIVVP